jgi:hypothetical protein
MNTTTLDKDPTLCRDSATRHEELSLPLPQLIVLTTAQMKEVSGGCDKCGRSAVLAHDLLA